MHARSFVATVRSPDHRSPARLSCGGFDATIGEGGDDLVVGSDAQDKLDAMSGFDWVTDKNDTFGRSVGSRCWRACAWY